MSVAASVVLATARTLLNDDSQTLWTDAVLMPKLAQAHRELQTNLRFHGSPVMKFDTFNSVNAVGSGATTIASPANMVEPIKLWERASGGTYTAFIEMTEVDVLPVEGGAATLKYWQWSIGSAEAINFIGANNNREIRILYWKSLTVPTTNTDLIGFINGELYLAPRVAALAAGSVGNEKVLSFCTAMANESFDRVVLSNRGRLQPASGTTARP